MQCILFYFWKNLAKGQNFGLFFRYWTQYKRDSFHLFSSNNLKLRNTWMISHRYFNQCKLSFWIRFKLTLIVPLKVIFHLCSHKSWLIIWQFFEGVTFLIQGVLILYRHYDENIKKIRVIYDSLQFTWIPNQFL